MKYEFSVRGIRFSYEIGELERALHKYFDVHSDDFVTLGVQLPHTISAKVQRNGSSNEMIHISSKDKSCILKRDTHYAKGDIGVSCPSEGDIVSVRSFNIRFRAENDTYTDRGLVWVIPGNPVTMSIGMSIASLQHPGLFTQIFREAEEAVQSQLYSHLGITITREDIISTKLKSIGHGDQRATAGNFRIIAILDSDLYQVGNDMRDNSDVLNVISQITDKSAVIFVVNDRGEKIYF